MSEFDEKQAERLEELLRKANVELPPELIEKWNERKRRDLGFIGYGRGSQRDSYRRGLRHVAHAINRLAAAGPEYAEVVKILKAVLDLIPPFQEK